MENFQPYIIHHLPLQEIENFQPAKGNHYIVIWCEEIPLGNIWLKVEEIFQRESFFNDVHKAIYASVEYYMNFCEDDEWKKLLSGNNFNQLHLFLIQALHQFKSKLNQNETEKISVIICTRNRAEALNECLSSLTQIIDDNVEIIVVDNASDSEATKNVVQKFFNVKYIFEERAGLDIARNTGALHASYNIIAYTDDDVKIPANWISNIRTCFANPLTMAVTGIVLPFELQTSSQYIFEKDWGFNKGYVPVTFDHGYFLKHKDYGVPVWDIGAGANMAFRREVFNLAGLFDERLDVGAAGCSGDSEIWYRILAEGWNCVYFPHLYVHHQHRKSLEELKKQLFSYMKGHVAALLIQHEKYAHKGNIKRLKKMLPAYYQYRLKHEAGKLLTGKFSSLITEVQGCIAGKNYYREHKHQTQPRCLNFPEQLYNDVVINDETLVSVIIPCYNHGHYLKEAIESALHQSYKNVEVIVIDDGSTDNTKQVYKEFENKVRYVYVERVGLSAARNIGVQFAKGKFVVFLDADDYLYEGAVELNLYFFSLHKTIAFVSGVYDKIDAEGNYIQANIATSKLGNNYISLLQGNYIAMEGTVMYRRDLFFYFHFDTRLSACEDYDLNLKISRHLPVLHHEKKVAVYRMHSFNMSKNKKSMLENALHVLKRQEKLLRNDEEKQAFKQGIKNWENYYTIQPNFLKRLINYERSNT